MGFYQRHLAPRVVDTICSPQALGKWRGPVVADLSGHVIEIGFGAGRNLAYYPDTVSDITAVEPSPIMRRRAQKAITAQRRSIHWGGLDGQHLDLPDHSYDAAVVTFALCTIPDPALALRELMRVVRPGGELRVLEHGLAPDPDVARRQKRFDRFEQIIADGCHLTRDPVALVNDAGWEILSTYQRFAPGPKPWTYFTSLRAQHPGAS